MRHGIDGFYLEIERFRRRLFGIGVTVSLAFLAAEFLLAAGGAKSVLDDPKRFGFEGRDQYVKRILLETVGPADQPGANDHTLVPLSLRAGGGERKVSENGSLPVPTSSLKRRGAGEGEDEVTIEARMRALALEGPVVQSEDLVVERLVRPEYPEEARDRNIEGLVELVALIDTTGAVMQVHVLGGTKEPLLEEAATSAVLQCRYRPYRTGENLERVWAYFRISFTLY